MVPARGERDVVTAAHAAAVAAALSALFVVAYGGTNWFTSRRDDVGTLYFAWEHALPFVPVMILPYMSIDLFFIAAPFLARTRDEIHVLSRRVIVAILLSSAGFLIVPLRFAFERPDVPGALGAIFAALTTLDRPHNLLPSLHVSLLATIWPVYRRRTRGLVRSALDLWFALVAASTVLTWQHHVLDVVAGGAVAVVAARLSPHHGAPAARATRLEIGAGYAGGAVGAAAFVVIGWPWTLPFAWVSLATGLVACGYFGAGPRVFAKSTGRLGTWNRIALAPYLAAAELSLRLQRHGRPAWAEVAPGVLLGRRIDEHEAPDLVAKGVSAVLDLTAEFDETVALRGLAYANVPVLDLTAPTAADLDAAVAFIREHVSHRSELATHRPAPVRSQSAAAPVVYVHCALGCSRGAAAVAAYLLSERIAATVDDAVDILTSARPGVVVGDETRAALEVFRRRRDAEISVPKRRAVHRVVAGSVVALARLLAGNVVRWRGTTPEPRPRVYFANHASHLDAVVVWSALPRELRAVTRPVAARDYWGVRPWKRLLAERVFHAVLVARNTGDDTERDRQLALLLGALDARHSLILFPEGTRGRGSDPARFKSGLYHLALRRPDVELVPVRLDNLDRILPKGAVVPVPMEARVTFGAPIHLDPGEPKDAFLERARHAVRALGAAA